MSRPVPPSRATAVRRAPGGVAPTGRPAPGESASARPRSLLIRGQLRRPLALTVAELRERWPQRRTEVVFDCAKEGLRRHTFDGPLLRDVLDAARPAFDARRRKDRSRFLLSVVGGDGHRTVLSWAEIDADFGDAPILLATALDGHPLDGTGSQLVVPSDRCGARYISAITTIWVGTWDPTDPA
ncbi:molybdopterin-dependent oxidoreductase [Streptomyces kronopolitis]|uniref:molybdopterin-dependent oxidoreductase n=1 Tax=Streptomyces kronopolitis TaxID=1612435 RepID=UPI0020BFCF5F|nr:molybdopterin-dependent oxidoreductase [Streptomyces kronopolitis]MCL6298223.1 molybdopterin-dependent oxidoreductase [Streptomyces kronopolitis]